MIMASVQDENCLSPYRKLLVGLSIALSSREVETLKLVGVDFIPRGTTEKICSGLQFFDVLEQDGRIGPRNLALLHDMLKTIGRADLTQKIKAFLAASVNDKTDENTFPDGFIYKSENGSPAIPVNEGSIPFLNKKESLPNGELQYDRMQWQHLTDDDSVPDGPGDDPPPKNEQEDATRHTDHFREIDCNMAQAIAEIELVEQAGKAWETVNDLLLAGKGQHNLFVGKAEPGDILLHQEQRRAGSELFRRVEYVFQYSGKSSAVGLVTNTLS
ncbi:hypothetical protein ACROYT_G013582 [Oculina patagonica]